MQHNYIGIVIHLLLIYLINCESNADIINRKVERTIDLTTHIARIQHLITIDNRGSSKLNSYTFVIEPEYAQNLAYIGAQLQTDNTDDENENELRVTQIKQNQPSTKGAFYKIEFANPLEAGKSVQINVECAYVHSLKPYPSEITQNEKQFVIYKGNSFFYSQYLTQNQVTKVNLGSDKIEAYTQYKPSSKSDSTITYGPYDNVKPFEQNEITIHYENNSPFLIINNMLRTIEISNWGNIAVEETIDMYHSGALLKGPFSRIDYMRRIGGSSSVKSFKTILPASANSVYYRDEIGNISTSNLRKKSDSSELELRPRFPLFGGWKTHYTVGYNLPTYEFLFNKGNDYLLKMKFVDHVYDDQLIEHLTVKIILPEHSKNIEFNLPYPVQRGENDLHFTYLDVVGRPVIVLHKDNVLDNHIQDFELTYKFDKILIIQEPLLLVAAFFLLFTLVIIVVRIDFSITHDTQQETRLKFQAQWEQVRRLQEKRDNLYLSIDDLIEKYKSSNKSSLKQSTENLKTEMKKIENELKQITTDLDNLNAQMKALNVDAADKITQLNQHDKQVFDNYQKLLRFAIDLVEGKMDKENYIESRKQSQIKLKEIKNKIDYLVHQ